MRLSFIVNRLAELRPVQTTSALIHGALARGHRVGVVPIDALELSPADRVIGLGALLEDPGDSVAATLQRLTTAAPIDLGDEDAVLIRTNPARDDRPWAHGTGLDLLRMARDQGAVVLNDPDGLVRGQSKLYLQNFADWVRPRTLISNNRQRLRAFVQRSDQPVVVKPLVGTRGQDVFKVDADTANLSQILDVLCRQGHTMAQDFVPEAVEGDTRVLLLDGRLLQVGDAFAAVRRIPPSHDFRSNVHQGGRAAPAGPIPRLEAIVEALGPRLRDDGLFFVGMDLIGPKIVELNVFSPGGVGDASDFAGVDFLGPILDAVEARVSRRR